MKVGDKVLYCKVVNDFTTEELVDILHIDEESKSATIYIPTLKRERDTDLTRLYVKQVDDTVDFTLPKRQCSVIPMLYSVDGNEPLIGSDHNTLKCCILECASRLKDTTDYVNYNPHGRMNVSSCVLCINSYGILKGISELYTDNDTIYESLYKLSSHDKILYELQKKDKKELLDMIISQNKYIYKMNEELTTVIKNYDELSSVVKILVDKSNGTYRVPGKKSE